MQLVSKEKQAQNHKISQELLGHPTQQSKIYIFCLVFNKRYWKKYQGKELFMFVSLPTVHLLEI